MISLDVGKHRKARVWIGELPISSPKTEERSVCLDVESTLVIETKLAAIELLIPQGGRAAYGILGAEFIPNKNSPHLLVIVNTSEPQDTVLDWTLASSIDEIRVGMPREFVDSVIQGVKETKNVLGSGTLRFNCVASGSVGSSPHIFWLLSRIVLRLLRLPKSITAEQLESEIVKEIENQ